MQHEQTPKQVQPEDTETIQIEERDAKRELNRYPLVNSSATQCVCLWFEAVPLCFTTTAEQMSGFVLRAHTI